MVGSIKKTIALISVIAVLALAFALAGASSLTAGAAAERYYGDVTTATSSSVVTETVNYASKTEDSNVINSSFPNYYNTNSSITNTCANVGGANIIGFYDRYYNDLIPNCTVGILRGDVYTYLAMTVNLTQKQDVINALYTAMGTNTIENGTSQAQFHTGLTSYVNGRGKSVSYTSYVTSSGTLDWEGVTAAIDGGTPVALYMADYNIATRSIGSGSDVYSKEIMTGNHIAIAYGYNEVKYYNANGTLTRTIRYFNVSTGYNRTQALYIVGNNGTLDDAEAVSIY